MNNFIIDDDFLVLNKCIKTTKKDANGNCREYGSIDLYSNKNAEFERVLIFENYKEILDRYSVGKVHRIRLQISIITKNDKSTTYLKIL